jgi:DNA primase
MAKLAQTSVKYQIKIGFNAEGVVEKPDIIGALFGQTEGLLGSDLDLRELQRTGRIGRIDVNITTARGKSSGEIFIPSSLTNTETAIIAATLETIERVGPCDSKMFVNSIDDIRAVKRDHIKKRAQELLEKLNKSTPEMTVLTEEINNALRICAITDYKGLPAGPDVADSDDIIICEGRADVLNLLRAGIKIGIAVGGTAVPPQIGEISKQKDVTLFIDGDRGGDLILKGLRTYAELDFIARAPDGKEVEELTRKEIHKALREKVPISQAKYLTDIEVEDKNKVVVNKNNNNNNNNNKSFNKNDKDRKRSTLGNKKFEKKSFSSSSVRKEEVVVKKPIEEFSEKYAEFKKQLNELVGTRAASIFDKNDNFAGRVPVKELQKALTQVSNPNRIVMDGKADKKLIETAEKAGVSVIVAFDKEVMRSSVKVLIEKDLK